jgi:hypothetical protein
MSEQLHSSAALFLRKKPPVNVGQVPRADLNAVEKSKILTLLGIDSWPFIP